MSNQPGDRGTGNTGLGTAPAREQGQGGDYGQSAGGADSAARGGETQGASGQNFGSARSDYGSHAYGGRLDDTGAEGGGTSAGYGRGETYASYSGGQTEGGGLGLNTVLTLLAGIGIGAALMYILDPDQGRRRRALARDKIVSASNTTGRVLGGTARDLRNRAQGVIHEAGKVFGLGGRDREQDQGQGQGQNQGQGGDQGGGQAQGI